MNDGGSRLLGKRQTVRIDFRAQAIDEDIAHELRKISPDRLERNDVRHLRHDAQQDGVQPDVGANVDDEIDAARLDRVLGRRDLFGFERRADENPIIDPVLGVQQKSRAAAPRQYGRWPYPRTPFQKTG